MKQHDDKLIWEALQEGGMRQPARLDRARVNEVEHQPSTSGGEAGERNAVREVAEALRAGRISLKEVDLSAATLVVSTGGEKSIILKAVGYEGGHDIPVSQRPDQKYDDDWRPKLKVGGSPQDYEGGMSFGDDR
jgi:hypothetical protein